MLGLHFPYLLEEGRAILPTRLLLWIGLDWNEETMKRVKREEEMRRMDIARRVWQLMCRCA